MIKLDLPDVILRYLNDSVTALTQTTIPFAIGGAVAMAAYGYTRATNDVDIFIDPNWHTPSLRAMRKAGFKVERIHGDDHWIATREEGGQRYRIDLLYPSADPDWSAIQFPDLIEDIPFFPAEMIALSKMYVNTYESVTDIVVLLRRGIVDPIAARHILQRMDPELLDSWDDVVRISQETRPPRRRPPRKNP